MSERMGESTEADILPNHRRARRTTRGPIANSTTSPRQSAPTQSPTPAPTISERHAVSERYAQVRETTERIAAPLSAEDQTIQSMPDASPTKWHRAHTTWFFETFVLAPNIPGYRTYADRYGYLFNSYYEAVGPRHARPARGLITRPGVSDIKRYRAHVDDAMQPLLTDCPPAVASLVELGLHHEQQHQELILTDIKHAFSLNPITPIYLEAALPPDAASPATEWRDFAGGIYEVGHDSAGGFAFDNEGPVHEQLLRDFRIMNRPVSVGEYVAFIADDGYRRPEFWLSDGWATAQAAQWGAPAYWQREADQWSVYTLHGKRPLASDEPACHVSCYEASAFAAWAGKRLPTEFEWEVAARSTPAPANWADTVRAHPRPLTTGFLQDVWEWTASPYHPYPGYRPATGAIGEYNGKFMINQMVLRGRSCATPPGHHRITYRNFFPPPARWQFSGFRLAEDA